jgi:serine/threonine protein kinase
MIAAPGSVIAARFRVVDLLGTGGMGVVYRCVDVAAPDAAPLAVKIIKHNDPELVARFRREIAVMRQLQGENLVRVVDAGEVDGAQFIAMELIDGVSLRDRLHAGDPLPVAEALQLGLDIARALDVAHGGEVLHRDVKPANILLTRRNDGTMRAVLLDFGIARSLDPAATITGTGFIVGTAGYIAPEVGIGGRAADVRSDLYSLGVVLYEALVGAPPFVGANAMALMARHATEVPIPPHLREPTIPVGVSALVTRLMARDPARRPPTAATTMHAITSLLEGRDSALVTMDGDAVEDKSEFFSVTWEQDTRLVRVTRTAKPFERAEDTAAIYGVMRDAYPLTARADKALLIDARSAPARADPRFAKIVAAELPGLLAGWRRTASLVKTAEGLEQLKDIRKRAGVDPRGVFADERAALLYLLSTEHD